VALVGIHCLIRACNGRWLPPGRGAKAVGGVISVIVDSSIQTLIRSGSLVSLGFVAVWVCDAIYVSRIFKKLVASQEQQEQSDVEMSMVAASRNHNNRHHEDQLEDMIEHTIGGDDNDEHTGQQANTSFAASTNKAL
jgi:hypothetical protein